MEVLKYVYRKTFGLSSEQLENEPASEFFTNLYILGQINEKGITDAKHGTSK